MATLSVDKFVELVRKSGLVEESRLNAVLEEVARDTSEADGETLDSLKLAQKLLDEKLLTPWQCDRLKEGRHKGFVLGKYKLLGLIGTGGMSSVYLAEHVLMQRRVAIKVLPQSRVDDSSYLARFRREAQAVAALDHKNIVRAYDIDNDRNIHYIVMEYVEGRDLQTIVKNDGPLDYDTAADYIRQSAEGLEHAHQANLIHRDIKPANLLVDPRGTVKILDMGLARFTDEQHNTSLTRMHDENVLGTADYLAPEQAKDSHTSDHRADIYSLGCTLYYLLTGHPPFHDGTLAQRILKHQTQPPPSIYEDRPDAPKPLVEVCMRMMAKQPAARFQTAGEVARVLTKWLESRGNKIDASSPTMIGRAPSGATPPPRRSASTGKPGSSKKSPDDTVSDKNRVTMKGSARGSSAKLPRAKPVAPGGGTPGSSPGTKPDSQVLSRGDSDRSKSGGSGTGSRSSSKGKALPVARPLDGSGKSKIPDAAASPIIQAEQRSALDLLAARSGKRRTARKQPPQWIWWSILGGLLLAVFLLIVFLISQS